MWGETLRFEAHGQMLSGERLVFLPGLDGTGLSYEPLRPFLAPDAAVTVVRYPTDKILSFAETVECAAEQTASAEGAVVVAESFSGPVAVELLGTGKLKAKCLILCATFARSPWPLLLGAARHLPLAAIVGLPFTNPFVRFALGGRYSGEVLAPMWHEIRKAVPPRTLAHRLKVISEVDVTRWLPKLALPVCYLQATEDHLVPPAALLDFEKSVPVLTVNRIKGPHLLLQTKPKESISLIEDFVKPIHISGRIIE